MIRFILATAVAAATVPVSAQTLEVKLVKPFHVLERSETLLVHHDQIVAGRTGTESEGGSFVESYDASTYELKSSVLLRHSIRRLKAIDDCKVLVASTELFSVINYCVSEAPAVVTRSTPSGIVAHEGAAISATEFVFIEPNEGLIRVNLNGRERRLGDNVSYTRSMDYWNDSIWIANYFNVWKIDPVTGARLRVLKTDSEIYGFKYTFPYAPLGIEPLIVATAHDDMKMLFISQASGKPLAEFVTKGEPSAMAVYGECLITVLTDSKQVYFFRMVNGEPKVITSWDALPAGDQLAHPTEIAVSKELKTIFLRSSYPCPSCSATQSSIYSLYEPGEATFEMCK